MVMFELLLKWIKQHVFSMCAVTRNYGFCYISLTCRLAHFTALKVHALSVDYWVFRSI